MSNVKKAYVEINNLLSANMDAPVSEIYDDFLEIATAKSGGGGGSVYIKDEAGNVIGLHCSYHKLWFKPEEVEFGAKASTASGFNNFSKDGMSKWTKQLAAFKKGKEDLLAQVMNGDLAPDDIAEKLADLEKAREEVIPMDDVVGYETAEELLASL